MKHKMDQLEVKQFTYTGVHCLLVTAYLVDEAWIPAEPNCYATLASLEAAQTQPAGRAPTITMVATPSLQARGLILAQREGDILKWYPRSGLMPMAGEMPMMAAAAELEAEAVQDTVYEPVPGKAILEPKPVPPESAAVSEIYKIRTALGVDHALNMLLLTIRFEDRLTREQQQIVKDWRNTFLDD